MNSTTKGLLYGFLGCLGVSVVLLVVFGIFFYITLLPIVSENFTNAQQRARGARVQADQRMIEQQLHIFSLQHTQFPRMDADPEWLSENFPGIADYNSISRIDYAFAMDKRREGVRLSLTTPVAYIGSFFDDPFRDDGTPYGYGSDGQHYFVITSWGPDGVDGIGGPNGEFLELHYTGARPGDGNAAFRGSPYPLLYYMYDASNGLNSAGDIIRVRSVMDRPR